MHQRAILALLLWACMGVTGSLADQTNESLSERLNPAIFSETSANGKLSLVSGLIECRFFPTSDADYQRAILNAKRAGNAYAAETIRTEASKCIGLTAEDFYKVEAILRELAEGGSTTAQMNYWRYVSPTPAQHYRLSDPSISDSILAQYSERFLMAAAEKGENSALLSLAQLNFSGELKTRDYVDAAAFIATYEACSGSSAPPNANQIFNSAKGLEGAVALRAEALVEEIGCGK